MEEYIRVYILAWECVSTLAYIHSWVPEWLPKESSLETKPGRSCVPLILNVGSVSTHNLLHRSQQLSVWCLLHTNTTKSKYCQGKPFSATNADLVVYRQHYVAGLAVFQCYLRKDIMVLDFYFRKKKKSSVMSGVNCSSWHIISQRAPKATDFSFTPHPFLKTVRSVRTTCSPLIPASPAAVPHQDQSFTLLHIKPGLKAMITL